MGACFLFVAAKACGDLVRLAGDLGRIMIVIEP